MRYYEPEHIEGYARIRSMGLNQWSDLHEDLGGYDDFPNRAFLERVLPRVVGGGAPRVLEYGCGTGPAACFLAERGYRVRGIDLVPDAIDLAREHAAERGLSVEFDVEDVCEWSDACERYDVVLDSYCLQSIVLDRDRTRVLDGVRRRLNPGGRYVLSTAVLRPERDYAPDHFDPATGIVWTRAAENSNDAALIDGSWYLPNRRHLTTDALRAELQDAGLEVLHRSEDGGDLVCTVGAGGAR